MKSVIISIGPEWCEKILNGEKTIEVRKSAPKELPIKAYIYETKGKERGTRIKLYVPKPYGLDKVENFYSYEGRGKVIGEFICDSIEMFTMDYRQSDLGRRFEILKEACLSFEEAMDYQASAHVLYAWHISDLKIYDTPKELSEFNKKCKHFDKMEKDINGDIEYAYSPCYGCKNVAWDGTDGPGYFSISFYYCGKNGKIPITRPPQSWQYIEEKQNDYKHFN